MSRPSQYAYDLPVPRALQCCLVLAIILAVATGPDYLKFYDDESYLLNEVGGNFRATGKLDGADLYAILVWKANRAKNYHRGRLKALVPSGLFQDAVDRIAAGLFQRSEPKEQLRFLMTEWGFYIATATAMLTILYPKEFTVYDYRVCDELGVGGDLAQRGFSEALWAKYEAFKAAVISATPSDLSLRDKDRYLTGRSLRLQIEKECTE